MRISTSSLYENAVNNFNSIQSSLAKSIKEISTGIKIATPADNPAASAQILITKQANALNTQFAINRQNANTALSAADGILSGVTKLLQNAASQVVAAGNGTLNDSDKITMVGELQSQLDQLMNLANSQDAHGNYHFSGSASGIAPYAISDRGVQYNGNQLPQQLQVSAFQQLPVTMIGSAIFGNIQVSPHAYFSVPNANNSSTATMSTGTVTNLNAVTMDNYSIQFTSPATYDVMNATTGVAISTGNAYTSGAPITIAGVEFSIVDGTAPSGVPVAGDQFEVQPGSQNVFQALSNMIEALKQPTSTPADQTNFANSVAQANASINTSLNNVLLVRSQIGNGLQQLSSLDSVGSVVDLSHKTIIGDLQEINYAESISNLSHQQVIYEAAQKVFASTSRLQLFNLI